MISTSAAFGKGLEELEVEIEKLFFQGDIKQNDQIMITNLRHKEELGNVLSSLLLVKQSLEDGMPEDFYSIDLMQAYASLGNILGEEVGDDLVEEIFSKFCMGK
jgi:tRNA modification GTPase